MQSSDQGKISPIKNLNPGCKWFYRRYECDYPLLHNAYNSTITNYQDYACLILLVYTLNIMLGYLIIVLVVAPRSLGQDCIHEFDDAEEAIINGSLGVLSSLSSAFYPTSERHTEYLVIRYLYESNCSDETSSDYANDTVEYIWASSSVYLVVEPNALEDLTLGVVDVSQGDLFINLQCFCSSNPTDIIAIISRLTAYVSQHNQYNIVCA